MLLPSVQHAACLGSAVFPVLLEMVQFSSAVVGLLKAWRLGTGRGWCRGRDCGLAIQVSPGWWHFCSLHHMSCSCCRVADAVEHYLDFLSLLQEGLQQQVGVLVKSSLGDLEGEG